MKYNRFILYYYRVYLTHRINYHCLFEKIKNNDAVEEFINLDASVDFGFTTQRTINFKGHIMAG